MVFSDLVIISLGFAVLLISVREAVIRLVRIARYLGISEYTISFILLGALSIFPELAIGVMSAFAGYSSFGFGIVIGSNIIDLTLIIGIVATVSGGIRNAARLDLRFLLCVMLPILMLIDGSISRIDGAILVLTYLLFVRNMLPHRQGVLKAVSKHPSRLGADLPILLVSLVMLFAAGHFIGSVSGSLAESLGMPLVFFGSILAIGTCIPELTFALRASHDKHPALGLGNVLGNVFADCLVSVGLVALVSPITPKIQSVALMSGGLMILGALMVFFMLRKKQISRMQGIALILAYVLILVVQTIMEHSV